MRIGVERVEGEIDYAGAMKEFGIDHIESYLHKMKDLPVIFRRGIVFGHRDFGSIFDAIQHKKKFVVLTGVNPSSHLHLGHLMFLQQAKFFQERGAEVFIPISNDETYVFKKTHDLEKATRLAMESIIPDIIALGFDKKKTKIFISTQTSKVYELAIKLSTKATFSTIKAIFGFTNETNPGQIFYSVVQGAHILFPQIEEFGGPRPTVVPVGIDQDPYMRLVRDVADKLGFVKPSSTYNKFLICLHGGKMSSSLPHSCIFLNDKPEATRNKIMKAFSGGAATLKEHKEKGGNPDIDVACQYLYYFFEESDKKIKEIFENYRNGSLTTGEAKNCLADKVEKFLKQHHKRKERAKKSVEKFLLK